MDNEFVFAQLSQAASEDGEKVRIKAVGTNGESKWVLVSPQKFEQILDLFQDEN